MQRFALLLGSAAMSLAATQAMAQMSPADKTFATKAATGGLTEVSIGQLAASHAASPQVRQLGQQLVSDHGKADDELKTIARQQDMTVPTNLDSAHRATEQRLAAMNGRAFDDAFLRDVVQDHQEDIADFKNEAQNGQNPALKQFAQRMLPVLQQHLDMAQSARTASK